MFRPIIGVVFALMMSLATGRAYAQNPAIIIGAAAAVLVGTSIFTTPPPADKLDYLTFEGGDMDVVHHVHEAPQFGLQYHPGISLFRVKPFVGVDGATNGAFYGYGGFRMDTYWFDDRLVMTPSIAVVGYDRGGGKYLGSSVVFRTAMDVQYVLPGDYRIGVAFAHMSHAKFFGNFNPGTETLTATFSVPFDRIFGP